MEQQLLDHILLLYEASNWILMGYSNKGRDVLGNSFWWMV
jgi:hypothetical protein